MSIDFSNLVINRLVIHEVYKRDANGEVPPKLNDKLTTLNARGLVELQTRIIEAVGHGSHSLLMDIVHAEEGSVYSNIAPFLNGIQSDNEFIKMSQRLVTKLVQCQTSQIIPGGIVIIFQGTTGISNHKYIGIIKADKITGFEVTTSAQETIMNFLNNLLLTPQQKLYKVAVAVRNSDGEAGLGTITDVSVAVFDSNNNKAASNASATYFYETFLGCTFQRNNDLLTKEFFNYTQEFINKKSDLSGKEKVEVMSALYVYMKVRTDPHLNINDFADTYLSTAAQKDAYKNFMASKNVPAIDIVKDLSMISNKLKKRRLRFSNSIDVYAPADNFSDNISIISSEPESTTVKIKGIIESES
jgi:hypothetical protein